MSQDMQPMNQTFHVVEVDTGDLAIPTSNATEADGTVLLHDSTFTVPGANAGVRIHFDADLTQLPGTVGVDPSFIKLTSVASGHHQILNGLGIQQWYHTSAGLQGDAFRLQVFAYPGTAGTVRVRVRGATCS